MPEYNFYKFKAKTVFIKSLVYIYAILKHITPTLSCKLSSYISKELNNLTSKYPYIK